MLLGKLLGFGSESLSVEGVGIGWVSDVEGLLDGPQVVEDGSANNVRWRPETGVFSVHKHLHSPVEGLG